MSEENETDTGPAFELRDGTFYRLEDGKAIAHVVCSTNEGEKPTIEGLHHTQEKYRDELEALIAPEVKPEEPKEPKPDIPPKPATKADATEADAPKELFDKSLGDRTPEVIEWRRENWTAEQFATKYPNF